MKTRIIQRTIKTETFNKWTGDIEVEEQIYWLVQEKKWYWPFWETCGYEDKKGCYDFKFKSYEEANKWRINRAKGNKEEITDVILD